MGNVPTYETKIKIFVSRFVLGAWFLVGTVIEYIVISFCVFAGRQYDFKIGCRLVLNPLIYDALLKIEILINHISGFRLSILNHIWIVVFCLPNHKSHWMYVKPFFLM